MRGPWLSGFVVVIIIQHDDAVSGGHGGSNPPEGESVGDFVFPAGRGWGLRKSPSSITPSLQLTHVSIFLGFSNTQPCPTVSSLLVSSNHQYHAFWGPKPPETSSPHPSSTPHIDIGSFSFVSPLFVLVGKLPFPRSFRATTSHTALQISLTSPRTGATPVSTTVCSQTRQTHTLIPS